MELVEQDTNMPNSCIQSKARSQQCRNRLADLKKKNIQNRKKLEKKQDQKAAKTLSAILFAFIFTWTPYNINVVVNTFCDNCLDTFEIWQAFGKLYYNL